MVRKGTSLAQKREKMMEVFTDAQGYFYNIKELVRERAAASDKCKRIRRRARSPARSRRRGTFSSVLSLDCSNCFACRSLLRTDRIDELGWNCVAVRTLAWNDAFTSSWPVVVQPPSEVLSMLTNSHLMLRNSNRSGARGGVERGGLRQWGWIEWEGRGGGRGDGVK